MNDCRLAMTTVMGTDGTVGKSHQVLNIENNECLQFGSFQMSIMEFIMGVWMGNVFNPTIVAVVFNWYNESRCKGKSE